MTGLCGCQGFKLWYVAEHGPKICHCGHMSPAHIGGYKSCVGQVTIEFGVSHATSASQEFHLRR